MVMVVRVLGNRLRRYTKVRKLKVGKIYEVYYLGQRSHDVDPLCMATFPAPHTVQTRALSPLNLPIGQATQPEPTAWSWWVGGWVGGE